MTRRSSARPGRGRDFRALADRGPDRPRGDRGGLDHELGEPGSGDGTAAAPAGAERAVDVALGTPGGGAPDPALDAVRETSLDAVVIRVRRRGDGTGYVLLVAGVALERPADVRALASRLQAAARTLDAPGDA